MKSGTLIELVVGFCVRQIVKFGAENVDWTKVHADVDVRINKLIPGEVFDPFACALAGRIVDLCQNLCLDPVAIADIKAAVESKKISAIITTIISHCKHQIVA